MTGAALATAEQAAVDRLRLGPTRRPCACRGVVEARSLDVVDVRAAVEAHQDDEGHRLWSAAGGMAQTLTVPERRLQVPDAPRFGLRRVG